MAEHVYGSPNLQVVSPQVLPRGKRQLGIASRATSFSDDNEASDLRGWIRDLVADIIKHPQFDAFFPYIERCLLLEDSAWTAYLRLREDPDAKSKLASIHSSVWHAPPNDIWHQLVQLRRTSVFRDFQHLILAEVQSAYYPVRPPAHRPNHLSVPSHELGRAPSSFTNLDESSVHQHAASGAVAVWDQSSHVPTTELGQPNPSTSLLPLPLTTTRTPGQASRSRCAPDGMIFQCPSLNCPSQFKKIGFYIKHLVKNHPDFAPQHPDHLPEMSLRPRAPSSNSNDLTAPSSNLSRPILRGAINEEYMTASSVSGFDTLMFDDSEVLYMGGATSINGV